MGLIALRMATFDPSAQLDSRSDQTLLEPAAGREPDTQSVLPYWEAEDDARSGVVEDSM